MIERVTFVTNPAQCNLHCKMCRDHGQDAERITTTQMPVEWVEQIVGSLVPQGLREVIPSTMGEPLLYQDFETLLSILLRYGVRLNLVTNGTFPRGGVAYWAPLLLPVVSDVKFSVNGLAPRINETIMNGIDAQKQRENILDYIALRDALPPVATRRSTVTLQVTAQRKNAGDLVNLLRWAIRSGVDRFKVNPLWPHREDLQSDVLASSDWKNLCLQLQQCTLVEQGSRGPICLQIQGIHKDGDALGDCPFLGREAWVMSDGSFRACCHPDYEKGAFPGLGGFPSDSLAKVWASDIYQSISANLNGNRLCGDCTFRLATFKE
jgi:MoaA/NifB/PqqE/SkfB family radical SAM enzyme